MAYIGKRPVDTFPATNAITSTLISENAVGSSEIATNAVTTLQIADNAVTAVKIAENVISSRELAANTVATGNIADNAVDGTKIAQNSILTRHIDDGQVTTDQLGADAVTAAKLADDAVVTANIVDANVTTAKMADANVTTAKIADNAITAAKRSIAGNGTAGQAILSDGDGTFSYGSSGKTTEEIQDIVGAMVSSNTETNISVTYQDADGTIDFVVPNTLTDVTELGTLTTLTVDDIKINGTQIGHTSDEDAMSIASNGVVTFTQIPVLPNDAITQAKIADDAVGADQLAANSVVSASIVNGSIVSAAIAANTIATSNIADNAIDGTKIASNSILTRHIDDNQITGDQIADDIVLSGTGAIRMPDGTTAQRPGSPAAGMFRYNTTDGKFEGYTDSWGEIGGGGSNGFLTDIFDGTTTPATDGSRVAFTLSQAVSDEKFLMVFIDGVYQAHDAYSVSGTTLTMADAPVSGRVLTVHSVSAAVQGDGLNVDNFSGDGSDTTFTLSLNPTHENNTQVYIDGVYQFKNTYSVSGTTLTFSTAPPNGSAIEVMTHSQTTVNSAASLNATAISNLSEVSIASADHLMIFDATDSTLKKGLASDLIEQLTTEQVQDVVGAMVSSNTETGVAVTYEDGDGTLDFVLATAQPTVTSLGTLTALTVDDITIDGSTISDAADLTLDVGGDIILDADGGDITFKDGGTQFARFQQDGGNLNIRQDTQDKDILFVGDDGGVGIVALTLDMSDAGTARFNHDVVLNDHGRVLLGNSSDLQILHDASNSYIASNTGDFIIDSAGDIILDADGGDFRFKDGGTQQFLIDLDDSANSVILRSDTSDGDMIFQGNDGGSSITALTLDMSAAGAATFNSNVTSGGTVTSLTNFNSSSGNDLRLNAGSANRDVFVQVNGTTLLTAVGSTGQVRAAKSAMISQVAITSSSNAVAWDAAAAANAYHVTTENTTFSAPSNAVEGAIIQVEIAQGGTARTIAWNTVFEFAASTAPTVTATANKTDIFTFRYNGSVWQEIGRVQNLAQT